MRGAIGIGWKVLLVLWSLVVVGALFAFRSFSVPAGSMIPTLRVGDYMAVSVTAYGVSKFALPGHIDLFGGRLFAHDPQRGDVVVFALPRDPGTAYVKRVIGLPGDTVQMREGRLWLNGALVERQTIAEVRTNDFYGKETAVPTYKETLPGGRSYDIVEIQGDHGFNDNTEPFKVPPNSFFAMGDNRDNSTDSRVSPEQGGVGYVPLDNLIGRAELVFLSIPKDGAPSVPLRRVR